MRRSILTITLLFTMPALQAAAQTDHTSDANEALDPLPNRAAMMQKPVASPSATPVGTPTRPRQQAPYDNTAWLTLLGAVQGGGGWDSSHPAGATANLGVKFGLGVPNFDLQYDLLHGHSGFSVEMSGMLPVFRYPGPMADDSRKYVRMYFEPGLGYRAGGGSVGGYSSAKVMFALFDNIWDGKPYPYVEFERRFPFDSPLQGDNRISIGLIWAVCEHCGLD